MAMEELEKSWKTTRRDVRDVMYRASGFLKKVNGALYQPYFFAEAKRDFEQLIAQLDSIERGLKPKTVKYISESDVKRIPDELRKEKQEKQRAVEVDAQKLSKGTREAVRYLLREWPNSAGEAKLKSEPQMLSRE